MSKKFPLISIVIATFQSEKLLPKVLKSIRSQTYPQKSIEIVVVDGGSTDRTHEIAQRFHCVWRKNPRTEPVYAKFLGYQEAKGKYIVYLDHDEIFENNDSLMLKYAVLASNPEVRAVVGSGYRNPPGSAFVNEYINEFGDPFSFFIYRLSKDCRFFLTQMKKRYVVARNTRNNIVFTFFDQDSLPIIELCAVGSMTDRSFMIENFPQTLEKPECIPHFFYLLLSISPTLGMTKHDALLHYSSDTFSKYLQKISWRIRNNVYNVAKLGSSGFLGRSAYHGKTHRWRQVLFLPYSFLIIPVLIDALWLVWSRQQVKYLLHVPLCLFTSSLIVFHYCLKLLGYSPQLRSYDGTINVQS